MYRRDDSQWLWRRKIRIFVSISLHHNSILLSPLQCRCTLGGLDEFGGAASSEPVVPLEWTILCTTSPGVAPSSPRQP